jgi:hypothetical protein
MRHLVRQIVSAFAILGAAWLAGCGGSGGSGSGGTTPTPSVAGALKSFTDAKALETYIKQGLLASLGSGRPAAVDLLPTPGTPSLVGNFSTTNLQEQGVDEADRFKSDGRHFFILGRDGDTDTLRIRRRNDAGTGQATPGSVEITKLAMPADAYYSSAYLAIGRANGLSDLLLAVGESGGYRFPTIGAPVAIARDWFAPWDWRAGKTVAQWVDIADAAAPKLARRVTVDGYHVASRRIGETLYLVTRFTPNLPTVEPWPANEKQQLDSRQAIQAATLADLLPKWSLDDVEQGPLVDASTCYRDEASDASASADFIIISAIDLGNPQAAPRAQCVTGGSEAVYASSDALYVATVNHGYGIQPVMGVATTALAQYPAEIATRIHKFALGAQGPSYRGSGNVAGHLGWEQDKKSFRMGDHQGVLRVATSLGETWDGSASTRLSLLTEGNGQLNLVSELPNKNRPQAIGKPGESLYAARFIGTRGYLVTFRVTDPLYVLDLADISDPKIAGKLAVPGYSDYLQPLGERWLIGVGKDAVPDTTGTLADARGAWYQGVKVALFDVADPARPREVNSIVIGKRGSQSAALYDHHAFTLLETGRSTGELARLALPVERYDILPASGNADDPRTWYEWRDTALHLFSVTDAGLVGHGQIIAEARGANAYPLTPGQDDRAFLNGEEAHYLHGQEMWAGAW